MANPSARIGDDHKCPMVDPGPKPHVGGAVQAPCHPQTKAGSVPMATVTDKAMCQGPTDFIVTGSGSVLIGKKPAARQTDKTMHGGVITGGLVSVVLGGPTVGCTLGNPIAGKQACRDAAKGRTSGSTQQSYGNCGIESSRQIINKATGKNIDEDVLLNTAIKNGWAAHSSDPAESGGTSPSTRQAILSHQGVASTLEPQGMKTIQQAVAEGKGVISSHDAGLLWKDPNVYGGHAVLVTSVEYDADGKPKTVFINDTGINSGNCGKAVPAKQFENSLSAGRDVNVTANHLW